MFGQWLYIVSQPVTRETFRPQRSVSDQTWLPFCFKVPIQITEIGRGSVRSQVYVCNFKVS